jgi:hypothetical protein
MTDMDGAIAGYARYYKGLAPTLGRQIDALKAERAELADRHPGAPSYVQDRGRAIDEEIADLAEQLGHALDRADCESEQVMGYRRADLASAEWMARWGGLYAAAVAEHRTFDLDQLAREE